MVFLELSRAPPCSSWSFFFSRRSFSLHFERNRYRYIFKYTCIRKFLYVYSIFDECKLAVIIHDDERGKERKEERERKNPILLKSHRSIENQVSENLLLSSRTTDALSDPRRVEIHFPPRGSHFFSPFLPLVNPFSPPSLSTAKRGADIADPNYRVKNSKRRGAVPRGDAIIFQIGGYPPLFLPPFLNLFSLFFFNIHFSHSLPPLPFLFIPANIAELREPRPSTPATREYQLPFFSPFFPILSLSPLQRAFFPPSFPSLSLSLSLSPSAPLSPVCIEEGHRYRKLYQELSWGDFTAWENSLTGWNNPEDTAEVWQYSRIFLFLVFFNFFFFLRVTVSPLTPILLFVNTDLGSDSDIFVREYDVNTRNFSILI